MRTRNCHYRPGGCAQAVLLVLILVGVCLPFVAYAQPTVGLEAHWPFDEGVGATAFDATDNGNDGSLENGPVWSAGRLGGALSFDGVDDYLDGVVDASKLSEGGIVRTPEPVWIVGNIFCGLERSFRGVIEEVVIFNSALSGEQVAQFSRTDDQLPRSGYDAGGVLLRGVLQHVGKQSGRSRRSLRACGHGLPPQQGPLVFRQDRKNEGAKVVSEWTNSSRDAAAAVSWCSYECRWQQVIIHI